MSNLLYESYNEDVLENYSLKSPSTYDILEYTKSWLLYIFCEYDS